MLELDEFTPTEIIEHIAKQVAEEWGFSKAFSRKLVLNALSYTLVIDEIKGQIRWLLENQ